MPCQCSVVWTLKPKKDIHIFSKSHFFGSENPKMGISNENRKWIVCAITILSLHITVVFRWEIKKCFSFQKHLKRSRNLQNVSKNSLVDELGRGNLVPVVPTTWIEGLHIRMEIHWREAFKYFHFPLSDDDN